MEDNKNNQSLAAALGVFSAICIFISAIGIELIQDEMFFKDVEFTLIALLMTCLGIIGTIASTFVIIMDVIFMNKKNGNNN